MFQGKKRCGTALFVALALFSIGGVSCAPKIPFSFEMDLPLGQYDLFLLDIFGALVPGAAIPDDFGAHAFDVCNLPTQAEIREEVALQAGDWVANLIHLDEMTLLEMNIEALEGDFSWLTYVSMGWQPKPVEGVPQAPIDFGTAESAQGFDDQILLTPESSVNFLKIIEDDAVNPDPSCSAILLGVRGVVPQQGPNILVVAKVRVSGYVQF